jgi:SAM-dependent methyltransferase
MPAQQLHDYSEEELLYSRFMEPALRQAMSFLSFPKTNARVLDAGCGPGGLFALLLEALGPRGALVALDRSTPHLEVAKKLTASQALEQRVHLAQVDLESTLPYPDGSFDGIWSADVITPDDFADIPRVVSELFRVLKPGGSLFLFYGNWLRQQLLPGHSRLEHLISIAKEFALCTGSRLGRPQPPRMRGTMASGSRLSVHHAPIPTRVLPPATASACPSISRGPFPGHLLRQGDSGIRRTSQVGCLGSRFMAQTIRSAESGFHSQPARLCLCAGCDAGRRPKTSKEYKRPRYRPRVSMSKLNQKEHIVCDQSAESPYLACEEVRGRRHLPVGFQKRLPGGLLSAQGAGSIPCALSTFTTATVASPAHRPHSAVATPVHVDDGKCRPGSRDRRAAQRRPGLPGRRRRGRLRAVETAGERHPQPR